MPPAKELELLLAEERWMRALAARLVSDSSAADDLVQETYLAALSTSERPRSIRAWLGRILRNRWRDQARTGGRRASREREAARPEALPSSDDLVAEVELRKRVAEAVLALEEPLRRTIVLRFFQGRTLESIAAIEGASLSGIHARVQRGLERLRAELDRTHGGRRERWMAMMVPFVREPGVATLSLGGMAMASGVKIAASILVIGTGVMWWWASSDDADLGPTRASDALLDERELALPEPELHAIDEPHAVRVATEPSVVLGAAKATSATILGRVVDADGNGVPGVELGWHDSADGDARSESGPDGAFELACGRNESSEQGRVDALSPELVTLLPGTAFQRWTVVIGRRAPCAGRVVDESGVPVAGAKVSFRPGPRLFRAAGVHAKLDNPDWSTTADEAGRFELNGVCGGRNLWLLASAPGFFLEEGTALPEAGSPSLLITLRRDARGDELVGIVLDPSGAPVAGAHVGAGNQSNIVTTDADGRFAVHWVGGKPTFVSDERGRWSKAPQEAASLIAVATGFLPASERLQGRDLALPFVLRLGPAPLGIAGVVRDPSGAPRSGIVLWIADPTPLAGETQLMDEAASYGRTVWVETTACGSSTELDPECALSAVTDDRGRFSIGCLMDRTYSVHASDPRTASRTGPWSVAAGTKDIELVFRDEPTVRVAGRVVSARGVPRAGLRIGPRRSERWQQGGEAPSLAGAESDVTTDAEGRFEFPALASDGTWLFVMGNNTFEVYPIRWPLSAATDPAHVEIVAPMLCEALVEISGDSSSADAVQMVDGEDNALELHEITGMENGFMIGASPTVPIVEGRSRPFLVAETASTLVLLKEDGEIARVPIRLEPGERTVLRP